MKPETANKKANTGDLPIPSFRLDTGQKAPKIVNVKDLADFIDRKRDEAKKELDDIHT